MYRKYVGGVLSC